MSAPDDSHAWLHAVRAALATALDGTLGPWRDNGRTIEGPGTLAVQVANTHATDGRHVDIGFHVNVGHPQPVIFWDCLAGFPGGPVTEAAEFVCKIWMQTTAPTVFELVTRRGEYADHARGDATLGLPDWHSFHGGILGYGKNGGRDLQAWCLANPIVPLVAAQLGPALQPDRPHGVKFFLGAFPAPVAEVRIDGERDDACSDALAALPWPKAGADIARFYVLFAHPIERESGA